MKILHRFVASFIIFEGALFLNITVDQEPLKTTGYKVEGGILMFLGSIYLSAYTKKRR